MKHESKAVIRYRKMPGSLALSCSGFILTLMLTTFQLSAEKSLEENSPFLPPGHGKVEEKKEAPVVQTQGPISREVEFRGIVQISGVYQFSIYNKTKQQGYWLKENEREDGISVSNFNESSSTINVLMNGRTERLSLMSATDSPLPVAKADLSSPANKIQATSGVINKSNESSGKRKVVPRRRVILPNKK